MIVEYSQLPQKLTQTTAIVYSLGAIEMLLSLTIPSIFCVNKYA